MTFHIIALRRTRGVSMDEEVRAAGTRVEYVEGRGLLDPYRLWRLTRRLRQLQPNIVHTHLTYANTVGTLAAKLARIPVVSTIHNVTTNQERLDGGKRLIESEALRRWSDCVIFVAKTSLAEAGANFRVPGDRLIAIPNAVDLTRFSTPVGFDRARKRGELGADDDARLVCTVGRLYQAKGHRFLLEAVARMASRHPTAQYMLVGAGHERERLLAQARELGISDQVRFLGVRDDIPELLAACDLFVLPSLNEGLSQAILEAMALGLPVVATRVGGTPDIVIPGKTGWLVPPGDSARLADAIDEGLSQPVLAATYARQAGTHVRQEYALDRHVRNLEATYRSVLARARSSSAQETARSS
jgi:glycosyltransferase involved in cell wall biosynthesis